MLPAGLEGSIEIYYDGSNCRALVNGNRMDYLELPSALREPFQSELIADKAALNFIRNEFKILDADLVELCFVKCRYGALDSTPDIAGSKAVPDSPCCKYIDTCKGFNIVCKIPAAINGHITSCEYQVICLVSRGKQDIEIADLMHVEVCTVRTYLARIREKLCVNNRIEIALWAYNKGI